MLFIAYDLIVFSLQNFNIDYGIKYNKDKKGENL